MKIAMTLAIAVALLCIGLMLNGVASADNDRAIPTIGVSSPNQGELSVVWSAPTDTGGHKDYRLSWSTETSGVHSWSEPNTDTRGNHYPGSTTTSHTITDLPDGTYHVALRARYDDNKSGPWMKSEAIRVGGTEPSDSTAPTPTSVPSPTPENTPEPTPDDDQVTTDVDEPGRATFSIDTFHVGETIRLNVVDPNGFTPTGYRWSRGNGPNGPFTPLPLEVAASYTPTSEDVGKYLRASVTYTDAHGEKTLDATTDQVSEAKTSLGTRDTPRQADTTTWTQFPATGLAIDGKFYKVAGAGFLMVWDSADETGTRLPAYEAHTSACGDAPETSGAGGWDESPQTSQSVAYSYSTVQTDGTFRIMVTGTATGYPYEKAYPPSASDTERWAHPPTTTGTDTSCVRTNRHESTDVWNNQSLLYIKNRRSLVLEAYTITDYGKTTTTETRAPHLDIPLLNTHANESRMCIGNSPHRNDPDTIYAMAMNIDGENVDILAYSLSTQQRKPAKDFIPKLGATELVTATESDFHFIPNDTGTGGTAFFASTGGFKRSEYTFDGSTYVPTANTLQTVNITDDVASNPTRTTGFGNVVFATLYDTAAVYTWNASSNATITTRFDTPDLPTGFIGANSCPEHLGGTCHIAISTDDGLVLYLINTYPDIEKFFANTTKPNITDFTVAENSAAGDLLDGFFSISSTFQPEAWTFESTDTGGNHHECFEAQPVGSLDLLVQVKVADPVPAHCNFDFEDNPPVYKITAPLRWPIGPEDQRSRDVEITITVVDENEPPHDPTGVTISPGATKFDVTWTQPAATGQPAVTKHHVHTASAATAPDDCSDLQNSAWQAQSAVTGGTNALRISSATPNRYYCARVSAENDEGASSWAYGGPTKTLHVPVITGQSAVSVAENTLTVATYTITDPDAGETVASSILADDDGARFTVANTGNTNNHVRILHHRAGLRKSDGHRHQQRLRPDPQRHVRHRLS